MTDAFDKAIHKVADALHLRLKFDIELSEQELLDDLSYGRDGLRLPIASLRPSGELS
jgi:hypothetical protein